MPGNRTDGSPLGWYGAVDRDSNSVTTDNKHIGTGIARCVGQGQHVTRKRHTARQSDKAGRDGTGPVVGKR